MTEFDSLKNSYIATIQFGLIANVGPDEAKSGNELLHKFCESLIDNSNCQDMDKMAMKHELGLLKETLAKEIECYYKRCD